MRFQQHAFYGAYHDWRFNRSPVFQQLLRACRRLGELYGKGRAKSASYLNDTPGVKEEYEDCFKRITNMESATRVSLDSTLDTIQ